MSSVIESQNRLRRLLSVYVNKGASSRSEQLLSAVLPFLVSRKIATSILKMHEEFLNNISACSDKSKDVKIDLYQGENHAVRQMMEYLSLNMPDDLAGAYIHGSLGTGEEEAYSDFDALVILKNNVFESRQRLVKVAGKLRNSLHIMYDFDPLQHHGWFVLTEADLKFYDESYFPSILFDYSKSLLHETGRELCLYPRESDMEEIRNFHSVAASVLFKLDKTGYPNNIYQLKSMLSEFMLLPTLFMQASKGEGVFKKDSFHMAEAEMASEYWDSMRKVSSIRSNWNYTMSSPTRWMMTRVHPFRNHVVNMISPQIPSSVAVKMDANLYESMRRLIEEMMEHCK